jgi:hypothetical protein
MIAIKKYAIDEYFKEVYEKLTLGAQVENYFLYEKYSTILESYVFLQVNKTM